MNPGKGFPTQIDTAKRREEKAEGRTLLSDAPALLADDLEVDDPSLPDLPVLSLALRLVLAVVVGADDESFCAGVEPAEGGGGHRGRRWQWGRAGLELRGRGGSRGWEEGQDELRGSLSAGLEGWRGERERTHAGCFRVLVERAGEGVHFCADETVDLRIGWHGLSEGQGQTGQRGEWRREG